jgi:hypothetical protein
MVSASGARFRTGSESLNRNEPCFSKIVRKGRDIPTAAALVQMEFLTK